MICIRFQLFDTVELPEGIVGVVEQQDVSFHVDDGYLATTAEIEV
jgi:hypothetical protein